MRCLLIIFALLLSSCKAMEMVGNQLVKPRPWGISEVPDGSPMFRYGWSDGCDTGLSSYGNDRYKIKYKYTQQPDLLKNKDYYRAWKDAYNYCSWYTYNWAREEHN